MSTGQFIALMAILILGFVSIEAKLKRIAQAIERLLRNQS